MRNTTLLFLLGSFLLANATAACTIRGGSTDDDDASAKSDAGTTKPPTGTTTGTGTKPPAGTTTTKPDAGTSTKPGGSFTCQQILVCLDPCADDDDACIQACVDKASSKGIADLKALGDCIEASACEDQACVEQACPTELAACGITGGG